MGTDAKGQQEVADVAGVGEFSAELWVYYKKNGLKEVEALSLVEKLSPNMLTAETAGWSGQLEVLHT